MVYWTHLNGKLLKYKIPESFCASLLTRACVSKYKSFQGNQCIFIQAYTNVYSMLIKI